jgi:uridine kinase
MQSNLVIGIAGGSGSGKTTVAEMIARELGPERIVAVLQDHYYRDLGHLEIEERRRQNFDHPEALDLQLMAAQVRDLKEGRAIERPNYDFVAHTRLPETTTVRSKPIVLVEGILILEARPLRELMDVKLFVETDDDIRFIRRLRRDIVERGRDVESVIRQYLDTVRPMHHEFVEPSRRHADFVLPWRDFNSAAIDMLIRMLKGRT